MNNLSSDIIHLTRDVVVAFIAADIPMPINEHVVRQHLGGSSLLRISPMMSVFCTRRQRELVETKTELMISREGNRTSQGELLLLARQDLKDRKVTV